MRLLAKSLGWLIVALTGFVQEMPAEPGNVQSVARVAFFYGYPSLVNGAKGDIRAAATYFSAYNIIVFGDGVEFPTSLKNRRPVGVGAIENSRTRQIIAAILEQKPNTEIYGYICLGDTQSLPQSGIKHRIEMWKAMGVSGIFLDEAGYDWRIVTRRRQNDAIRLIHSLGMTAFLNAYHPEHLWILQGPHRKNPSAEESALTSRDLILLESFPIKHGSYADSAELSLRWNQASQARQRFSLRVIAVTTTPPEQPFRQDQFDFACWSAWIFDLNGLGWGEPNFAANNNLPEHACNLDKPIGLQPQDQSTSIASDHAFSRRSTEGVVVLDLKEHTVSLKRAHSVLGQSAPAAYDGKAQNAVTR